ncbi:MAG: helix-turn-helix domain-containing protein [Trebonia sp.]
MDSFGSPTVRRRRLAAELRRLRGNRTGNQVARALGWSPTKVSRAESGKESLPPTEVEKLIDYYSVAEPLRGRLLELAEDAVKRGWWDDYADALTPEYLEFIGLEDEAASCLHWQSDVIPGLLQTEEYSRQLNVAYQSVVPTIPSSFRDRFVRVRMRRQERLIREPLLQLSVVIDEAVLLRRIGGHALMRAQLRNLASAATLPNVDLRVVRLSQHPGLLASSFVIMRFGPSATQEEFLGDVVSTESLATAEIYVEGETDTRLYSIFFDALHDSALSPTESRQLIIDTSAREWP